jgi:sugar transferase (PEP-CTERM system associated)
MGEALVVWFSFFFALVLQFGHYVPTVLTYDHGYQKIFTATVVVLLSSHWWGFPEIANPGSKAESRFPWFWVPAVVALAAVGFLFPNFVLAKTSLVLGAMILGVVLLSWRNTYMWILHWPILRERIYVLGTGEKVQRFVQHLRSHSELGIDVVDWSGSVQGVVNRETLAAHLLEVMEQQRVHRVIVAMTDRRGMIPVQELLQLRLQGAKIEEAPTWLERMSGKIEIDHLYPSWLIFADGFRLQFVFRFLRRALSFIASAILLILVLPLIPFVIAAIKLDSPGPVLYRQKRVGRGGRLFYCYKFRTMCEDAEADTGPTWALDDDPRITRVGRFLRTSRLDEIPQLWNVVTGDMGFVGPRPERPEFVEWLSKEIPYYPLRHVLAPGITGWAQVRYKYGNTVEDAKEKLQYDLYYIKNASISLDLLIISQTIKIVLLGRGGQ